MRLPTVACMLVLVVPGSGCDRMGQEPPAARTAAPPPPDVEPPASQTAAQPDSRPARPPWQPSDDPRTAKFLGLAAPKPARWIEHPPQSPLPVTTFAVPGRDGNEAAHIVVFDFPPGLGGSIDENIDRWQMQFEPDAEGNPVEPLIARFEVDGMPVTLVEFAGNWKKMGASWYTPDQLFLSAIVGAPRGVVVIRFAGAAATVEANRADFMRMIDGLRRDS